MGNHGDECTCEECREIAESVLLSSGDWEHLEGFAISETINPEGWEDVLYSGNTLEEALQGYFRKTDWWAYKPSNGEQVFEDFWDAVEYHEENM